MWLQIRLHLQLVHARSLVLAGCELLSHVQILQGTATLFPQHVAVSRNFPYPELCKPPYRQVETHQSMPGVHTGIGTKRCTVSKTIHTDCFYYEVTNNQF